MMKRTTVTRLGPDEPSPMSSQTPAQLQAGSSNMYTLAQSAQPPQILNPAGMAGVGFGRARPPPVINYLKAGVQYAPKHVPPRPKQQQQQPPELCALEVGGAAVGAEGGAQFQRLKVEDALSYLDQVKYKFNAQPQVYNDFLDIMKEFKSQTIDTPGVITRVSNLFKGHPELIVGFNTFLPPGYKIEVQSNGQVSVSMPSPGGVVLGAPHTSPQPHLVQLLPAPPTQSVSSAIVHNLSVSSSPANTLHHISQAHQQIEAASIHHTSGSAQPPVGGVPHANSAAGQPVEFNHAIEYVNKIKSRFSRQPDKYKRFLEILHAYQRGHRDVKEPQTKQQTEQEVYSQVAKLFENQDDLLAEFGQFLPDAKAVTKPTHYPRSPPPVQPPRPEPEPDRFPTVASPPIAHHHHVPQPPVKHPVSTAPPIQHLKRSPSFSSNNQMPGGCPPAKRPRASWLTGPTVRDVSYAEAAKFGTHLEYSFFDKAKKALKSQQVYDNFLRCLVLFTNEIISSSELVCVAGSFLCRQPELRRWLQDFLGADAAPPAPAHPPHNDHHAPADDYPSGAVSGGGAGRARGRPERRAEPLATPRAERPPDSMDIDLSTCKRLGTSYCALPRDAAARRCSGRTPLCKEVLNDTWVSFPTWSEDSTFVTSRKTQYEEYIYRCEDERFELDVVIETNASTIRVLEGVQKKLSRMSAEEAARYRLDDTLGGHSTCIHQRALRRIYGDKVAVDIIAGLKKNPVVAVPVVLRRLKAKEEEWREAQKGFNKQWREQNEKYYLKSLDHQGINFKQNDLKAMRSKTMFNEVESAYAARRPGPHLVLDYGMKSRQEAIKILRDCTDLLIHHARRQTAIQKAEKRKIKQLLRQFLPDLFNHPRQPLSDDERDEDDKEEPSSPGSPTAGEDKNISGLDKHESSESDNASDKSCRNNKNDKENKPKNNNNTDSKEGVTNSSATVKESSPIIKNEIKLEMDEEDDYRDHPPNESRFVCTSSWYLFLRLHALLCQRLGAARRAARRLPHHDPPAPAAALRLHARNLPADVRSPSEYYGALIELVKGVLDGNVEPSAFEDAAREMFGIHAYPAYTLDKIVSIAVRQLQHCVTEPWSAKSAELCSVGMRGPQSYVRKARKYLRRDHSSFLIKVYGGDECRVSMELLEGASSRASPHRDHRLSPPAQRSGNESRSGLVARSSAWSLYAERYARPSTTPYRNKPVFLARNARRCGGYTHNVAPQHHSQQTPQTTHHARRKPPRLHDHTECHLSDDLRLLSFRPLSLYRPGALAAAKSSHQKLHARRRENFKAWLTR